MLFRTFLLFCVFAVPPLCAQEAGKSASALELSSQAFRAAAERVLPATVKVISRMQTAADRDAMQIQIPALKPQAGRRNPGDSTGTGFIIDPKGIIITNNHVIAKGVEVEIELPDGRTYTSTKFARDLETDLAVIWVAPDKGETLPVAVFGNSDLMEIGDWVLAIGNPFELDSTVSAGIISAKGRSLRNVQRTEFLQTDAAINPGNSGGPLINLNGEIIGINTAIASRSGGNQGIGFASPSNNAQWVVKQLVEKGKVERAWFGAVTQPVRPQDVKRLNLKDRSGVLVEYAVQDSPAQKAGIQENDVIQSFDDQPVNEVYQLQRLSERADLNGEHQVVIVREGKRYRIRFDVKAMPPSAGLLATPDNSVRSYVDNGFGILVVEGTPPIISRLRVGQRKGIVVLTVVPGGLAEKAGVRIGMLLTKVDGRDVPTLPMYLAARETGSLSAGIKLNVVHPGGSEEVLTVKVGE
ncbi:MAG: trypsin-like peptidase domain-containing protein [Planctomycetaceae bacterium]|jgi:serine protease Do|nr:trypsin-like peptidase domain-containing protein [Planctomycetaceae bacterium]